MPHPPSPVHDGQHHQHPLDPSNFYDTDYDDPTDSPRSDFGSDASGGSDMAGTLRAFPGNGWSAADTSAHGGAGQTAASVTASYQPSDTQSLQHHHVDHHHHGAAATPPAAAAIPPPPQGAVQGRLPPNGLIPASVAVILPPAVLLPPALLPPSAQGPQGPASFAG